MDNPGSTISNAILLETLLVFFSFSFYISSISEENCRHSSKTDSYYWQESFAFISSLWSGRWKLFWNAASLLHTGYALQQSVTHPYRLRPSGYLCMHACMCACDVWSHINSTLGFPRMPAPVATTYSHLAAALLRKKNGRRGGRSLSHFLSSACTIQCLNKKKKNLA